MTPLTLKTYTLGCKVNQYETQYVRAALLRLGYIDAPKNANADMVLVNTCTVTAQSDLKCRKLLRKWAKENPNAEIVVMGCLATRCPELVRSFPQVGEIIADKRDIPEFLRRRGLVTPPTGISDFGRRHRAFVKVQDGCRVGCAYCIIPKVRPYLLSRTKEHVLQEIRTLSKNGYAEIVLTGIHLGHYGVDLSPKSNLAELVGGITEMIRRESLPTRIRVSSLEAVEVSGELVQLFHEHSDILCNHFHLSMQSGSDDVLQKMRRRWMSGPFREKCEQIQNQLDRVALSTDVIIGFPGETDKQFQETCELVEKIGFMKTHVFRFSAREGTEAASMTGQIPSQVKKERASHLQTLADRLADRYAQSLLGTKVQVLLETRQKNSLISGTADRYVKVQVPDADGLPGQLVFVHIAGCENQCLTGQVS